MTGFKLIGVSDSHSPGAEPIEEIAGNVPNVTEASILLFRRDYSHIQLYEVLPLYRGHHYASNSVWLSVCLKNGRSWTAPLRVKFLALHFYRVLPKPTEQQKKEFLFTNMTIRCESKIGPFSFAVTLSINTDRFSKLFHCLTYCWVRRWKNSENRSAFDKVTAKVEGSISFSFTC